MNAREEEYKKIFIAETLQDYDNIAKHILALEENPHDLKPVVEIFRMLHNLKANANAIGYPYIADYAHKLENVFSAIRDQKIAFNETIGTLLFEGVDHLGILLKNLDKPQDHTLTLNISTQLENVVKGFLPDNFDAVPAHKVYTSQNIALSELVSIEVKKLDDLMNLVGELIIDRDRILSLAKENDDKALTTIGSHLYRVTNEIQQAVMNTRLVSMGTLFSKFPRVVRDIALSEEKKVSIKISGQDIKIDRNILQIITDSLLHLIRNAIVHGIERQEERKQSKKATGGSLQLNATSDKQTVIVTLEDDGKGINVEDIKKAAIAKGMISHEKGKSMSFDDSLALLFEPGFSLSKQVTEFSGRGVGLDVVKNALDSIGGNIKIKTKMGVGTRFTLTLPTSIAVKAALLFEVNGGNYALPLLQIDSVLTVPKSDLHQIGHSLVTGFKGENISLIYLNHFLFSEDAEAIIDRDMLGRDILNIIIVNYNNRKIGLIVDNLLRQQDIVVKPLQKPVVDIDLFSGVTLLGTGDICLLLDVGALARAFTRKMIEEF